MKFELKEMYRFLLSHTFPGLLLGIEIILIINVYSDYRIYFQGQTLNILEFMKILWTTNTFLLIIVGYAFSTMLGIIVDCIHHFVEDLYERIMRVMKKNNQDEDSDNEYDAFKDNISIDVYNSFIDDDLYYYYEAYANLCVALLPGLLIFYYWLSSSLRLNGWPLWLLMMLYISITIITLVEAYWTHGAYLKEKKQFTKSFSSRKAAN